MTSSSIASLRSLTAAFSPPVNLTRPPIVLSVIVGNEEDVIERFIESFAPACKTMLFTLGGGDCQLDTSEQKIKDTCERLAVDYRILNYSNAISMPHVDNFGAKRQVGWKYFHDNPDLGDWIMWADCDDVLKEKAYELLTKCCLTPNIELVVIPYNVRVIGDNIHQQVIRERLVHRRAESSWKHAIHEQMAFAKDVRYYNMSDPDIAFWHRPLASKGGGKARNERILNGLIADNARNYFYLQQEAFEGGKHDLALALCKAGLASEPPPGLIETYEMTLNMAQLDKTANCRKLASQAFELMPDRREAIALLTCYAIIDKDYPKALVLAKLLAATPLPRRTYWSQNNLWYGWRGEQLIKQVNRLNGIPVAHSASITVAIEVDLSAANNYPPNASDLMPLRDSWFNTATYPAETEVIYEVVGGFDLLPPNYKTMLEGFTCVSPNEVSKITGVVVRVPSYSNNQNPDPRIGWDTAIAGKAPNLNVHQLLENIMDNNEIQRVVFTSPSK